MRQILQTDLKKRVLFLLLKLVWAKNFQTTLSFLSWKTLVVTLKERKNVIDDDGL
jgi:hypothetical protein